MKKATILNEITKHRLVAVVRGNSVDEAISIIEGATQGGIRLIELTYTTPFVQEVFSKVKDLDAVIGAGTVLDAETARHAILNGAQFVVSPHFNEDIAKLCNRYSVPYLPGCMTIKDIVTALESGCEIVKLFPANHFTPSFIQSVKGPLPHVQVMPTGGINTDNMQDWFNAGAVAVGIGSDLNKALKQGGIEAVVQAAKNYCGKLA